MLGFFAFLYRSASITHFPDNQDLLLSQQMSDHHPCRSKHLCSALMLSNVDRGRSWGVRAQGFSRAERCGNVRSAAVPYGCLFVTSGKRWRMALQISSKRPAQKSQIQRERRSCLLRYRCWCILMTIGSWKTKWLRAWLTPGCRINPLIDSSNRPEGHWRSPSWRNYANSLFPLFTSRGFLPLQLKACFWHPATYLICSK